jgi:hypothetical protein
MTYDHWKATEPDDGAERPEEAPTEGPAETIRQFEALDARYTRLRASHNALLAAAKDAAWYLHGAQGIKLRAAIAKAEEIAK